MDKMIKLEAFIILGRHCNIANKYFEKKDPRRASGVFVIHGMLGLHLGMLRFATDLAPVQLVVCGGGEGGDSPAHHDKLRSRSSPEGGPHALESRGKPHSPRSSAGLLDIPRL